MGTWYKLDSAGRIFPAVASSTNSSIFRVSMILYEPIQHELLQKAADTAIKRFPSFAVKLRRGVFWSFLGENFNKLVVKEETEYPCHPIKAALNNGYLIRVVYFNRRISVEVFHSITDGTGAVEFLKTLVFEYLCLSGRKVDAEGLILHPDELPCQYEIEDSYEKYYEPVASEGLKKSKAYHISGTPFEPFGTNVIHGVTKASALNELAKEKCATITEYLTAALIYSIYSEELKHGTPEEPVTVAVPVNLRKIFPSRTLRNFFIVINVGMHVSSKDTFDSILKEVTRQFKEKLERHNLYAGIAKSIKIEKMILARFVPIFIKNIIMRYGYEKFSEKGKTITLSNLGSIKLPQSMAGYIDRMDSVIYPTRKSPINCCVSSVNDKLTISFSRTIVETDIIRNFFSFLSKQLRTDVEIYSNNWGINI